MKARARLAPVLLLTCTFAPGVARASVGGLDITFGGLGVVTTQANVSNGTEWDLPRGIAIQNDGRILVAGELWRGGGVSFVVARYNTDGSLDASFDEDGIVTTGFSGFLGQDEAQDVAVQNDGKILLVGRSRGSGEAGARFGLVRYNADGSLDTSFDGDGIVRTAIGPHAEPYAVVLQGDGKIVVSGYTADAINGQSTDLAIVRYESDGSLDATFDGDGIVIIDTDPGVSHEKVLDSVLQTDGKIVFVGYSFSGTDDDYLVVRMNSDGSLDTDFDGDGIALTPTSNDFDQAFGAAIQDDGKIVVVGAYALVRYNADGSLDTAFDDDGIVSPAGAFGVVIQGDGKIVTTGGGGSSMYVARYNADGSVDTSFHGDGVVHTTLGPGDAWLYNKPRAVIQGDGKIVATGVWMGRGEKDAHFAVARYRVETACPPEPLITGCATASKLRLSVKRVGAAKSHKLAWTWRAGDAFDQNALASPDQDTAYSLCVYDMTSTVASLTIAQDIEPSAAWRNRGSEGWDYVERKGAADGVQRLQLQTGAAGTTQARLKSRGVNLPLPSSKSNDAYFDQEPRVVAQLVSSTGFCLTSEFGTSDTRRNDATSFQAAVP